ncbi:MAG: hypothetical protein HY314_00975 [Acidobacteria bacterium]|nr:hypothetical protein [Acidobacteriota bacterium]
MGDLAKSWVGPKDTVAEAVFRDSAKELDYTRIGFATTNDFLRIAGQRPDLLGYWEGVG